MTAGMKRGFSTVNALLIVVAVLFVAADALYGVMYYGKVRDCLNEHVVIETGSDVDLCHNTASRPLSADCDKRGA